MDDTYNNPTGAPDNAQSMTGMDAAADANQPPSHASGMSLNAPTLHRMLMQLN
jgi:hypothetical protein